jgi:DNA-binding response OmpR family regulator
MRELLRRVLILDTDPEMLITLQQVLEAEEVDTTITWDEAEARQLLETGAFRLALIGDHPPEINAATILHDASLQSASFQILILGGIFHAEYVEYFRGLGAIGVVPKREPLVVVERVARALTSMTFKPETIQSLCAPGRQGGSLAFAPKSALLFPEKHSGRKYP